MADDHTQARLQRMEQRLASLDDTVAILAKVDDGAAKERIDATFGADASLVIIYRGVQKGLSQTRIAQELRSRKLPRADQANVSRACSQLEDKGFLRERATRGYEIREGWQTFGIEKSLKKILRRERLDDLE